MISNKIDNKYSIEIYRYIHLMRFCTHKEGCNTRANCNKIGETKPLYCGKHKLDGMEDVVSKICIFEGCNTRASCNKIGETKPLYCGKHKLDGMEDITHKRCKTHLCETRVSNKAYEGYCLRCFMMTYPDRPVSRNYKTKERDVVDRIKLKFPDVDWIDDKKVSGGCSRRRPDLLLDLGYQVIIVEIDENKHTDYECSCENKRVMEISQDVGHRPIVFIRFNPDDYEDNGKKITSCWG